MQSNEGHKPKVLKLEFAAEEENFNNIRMMNVQILPSMNFIFSFFFDSDVRRKSQNANQCFLFFNPP